MKIILLIFILIVTIQDIRFQRIGRFWIVSGMIGSLLYRVGFVEFEWMKLFIDLSPGILFFLIAYFGKELIGYGDVAMFGILGMILGVVLTIELIVISIVINAIYGGIMLICRRKTLKDKVAFIPFLFIAYTVSCFLM